MNGAVHLVETMLGSGVNVCFANPGTSEMHFVAALDSHPDMRCVLCLFEGGVTGAADGYARMSGNVAGTLLHLGPGFANGWANLHNARKGQVGIVNIVGDHAGYHLNYDAPLQADLAGVAGSVSHWLRRAETASEVAQLGADAIAAARTGQIATVILPADCAWEESTSQQLHPTTPKSASLPDPASIRAAAGALFQPGAALLLEGPALYGEGAERAGRIAASTGARLLAPCFCTRLEMGQGAVEIDQLPYPPDATQEFLRNVRHLVCLGVKPPVNFFAYPGKASTPEAPGCQIDRLCYPDWDIEGTLRALEDEIAPSPNAQVARISAALPSLEPGPLTPDGIGRALALHLPEGAIIANEAITATASILPHINHAARHDRMHNPGGAIGHALPAALGAAIACPGRPVFALSGDGSAMYQLQTLWTMARERLNITVVIIANRGYQILHQELRAQGAPKAGRNARAMFDIEDPLLDWVALAKGHGVPGQKVDTEAGLVDALKQAAQSSGPYLIEASV